MDGERIFEKVEEIPKGVLDELATHREVVDLSVYGKKPIDPEWSDDVHTRSICYREYFDGGFVGFVVRADFSIPDTVRVFSVRCYGISAVIAPKV